MEIINEVIDSKSNLCYKTSLERANKKLRTLIALNPNLRKGYIFVDCPCVSDLFIVENKKIRKCTDEEWCYYFKTYICVPEKFDIEENVAEDTLVINRKLVSKW